MSLGRAGDKMSLLWSHLSRLGVLGYERDGCRKRTCDGDENVEMDVSSYKNGQNKECISDEVHQRKCERSASDVKVEE